MLARLERPIAIAARIATARKGTSTPTPRDVLAERGDPERHPRRFDRGEQRRGDDPIERVPGPVVAASHSEYLARRTASAIIGGGSVPPSISIHTVVTL